MKQFFHDIDLKHKIQKEQYKKHPKWKSRRWVRIILVILAILMGIYGFLSMSKEDLVVSIILNFGGMTLLGLIPWIGYTKALKGSCNCVVNYREHDTVVINDDSFVYIYHPSNVDDINIFDELQIKYSDITSIIYNKYHKRVDLYGKIRQRRYINIKKGKYTRNKNLNNKESRIRLYLYFNDNEEILEISQNVAKIKTNYKTTKVLKNTVLGLAYTDK